VTVASPTWCMHKARMGVSPQRISPEWASVSCYRRPENTFEMRSNGMHGNTLCSGDVRSPLTLREALHGTPFGVSKRTRCSQIRADRLRVQGCRLPAHVVAEEGVELGRRILDPVQSAPDITQVVYGTRSSRRNCGTIFDWVCGATALPRRLKSGALVGARVTCAPARTSTS
jgi:hypothetical protein